MALKRLPRNRDKENLELALKDIRAEKMVTLTTLVPESLRDKVKIKAIQNKTNVTSVILEYLKKYVGE